MNFNVESPRSGRETRLSEEKLRSEENKMNQGSEKDGLWSIVFAGGEGERLKPFIQR